MNLLSPSSLVALDLETTGLSAEEDRIVEMAAVRWEDGRETAAYHALVHPGRSIPASATAIHGITNAMVRGKPPVEAALPGLLAFCRADAVVAHNARFDLRFLHAACARAGLTLFTAPVIDSCAAARRRLPGFPNYRLETLTRLLGLSEGQEHRALQDARDCLQVYLRCLQAEVPTPPAGRLAGRPHGAHLALLQAAREAGELLMIEYRDGSGRTTQRPIRPLAFDRHGVVVEAYCLLRNDLRHFYLERIRRAWRPEGEEREDGEE